MSDAGSFSDISGDRIVPAILTVAMLATGYLIGWAHGASDYPQSAPMFMAGITVTALFALGLLAIQRRKNRKLEVNHAE